MTHAARYFFARPAGMLALAAVLGLFLPGLSARAQGTDPFEDSSGWKSFERYKEEQKTRLFSTMTGNLENDAKAAATRAAEEKPADDEASSPRFPSATKEAGITPPALPDPVMAAPERPLDPPVMPGVNKGFDVRVSTTEDDVKPVARVTNIDTEPELELPRQNWLDAAHAAQMHAEGRDAFEDNTPLHVRLSFLPRFEPPKSRKPAPVVAKAPPVRELPAKSAADAAACAAIDAYKKHQLEAIQSDRQTLEALQAAIGRLGLQKELSFMAGPESKINTPAGNGPLIDVPALSPPVQSPVAKP